MLIVFIASNLIMIISACPEVPETCERDKISFYLYTSPTTDPYELILEDSNTIKNAPFIPNANFKFIVHGYTGNRTFPEVLVQLREEYFKQKPWNILVVDWGPLAVEGCYPTSAFHGIPVVGRCCADLLNVIFQNKPEITPEHFHVIGFSMGAHVCAHLSNHIRPIVLPRLTGLDPAYPLFITGISKPNEILNKEHAKFVDVIHTNVAEYGVYFSDAHYDIYANGGIVQPGCGTFDFSCNHQRSVEIFTESINSKAKFWAHKCDYHWVWIIFGICERDHEVTIEIGEHCLPPLSEELIGTYQFITRDSSPFVITGPEA